MEMISSLEDLKIRDAPTSTTLRILPEQEISSSIQTSTCNIDDPNDNNESPSGLDEAVGVIKTQRSLIEAWMVGVRIPIIRKDPYLIH